MSSNSDVSVSSWLCPARTRAHRRGGFTLVELLVVIAIVAVLIGLLLPAVQHVREASNRLTCANNLKQLCLAAQNHVSSYGHFPTGGWGYNWVGDPDRGHDRRQPGGWIYNLLPFVEQNSLHDLGQGQTGVQKLAANAQRLAIPLPVFNCPTRRTGGPYPNTRTIPYVNTIWPVHALARSDYAANTGDQPVDEYFGGPKSYAEADKPGYGWPSTSHLTGVVFLRSKIRVADITNGTSKTYLFGEKYLDATQYDTGNDGADNETMFVGFDNDINRSTAAPPRQDEVGVTNTFIFGSAHPSGLNMGYCDGSVQFITYDVDPTIYRRAGNRLVNGPSTRHR